VAAPADRSTARASDLSIAFLVRLERLTPEERAALLLREVFDADYATVAEVLVKTEAPCRQLVSRARRRLDGDRPRRPVSADVQRGRRERAAAVPARRLA
jgi:RNA polymerase sigma-70 factor (ECF subfamily)